MSVASQTHSDVEHIIVDGASEDGTLDVINRHRDKFAKVVSELDCGIYDAMNKGVALASGEVVGFLNADDLYADDGVLARVAEHMAKHGLDSVYGDVEFFKSEKPTVTLRRYRSQHFRPDRIAWGWMPAHPTIFVRRNIFERYGAFHADYRIAGDFEFVARVFIRDALKYRYLPEVIVRMRTGGVSTCGWRSTLLLNKEVLRACRENDIATNLLMILSKYPVKLLEFFRK